MQRILRSQESFVIQYLYPIQCSVPSRFIDYFPFPQVTGESSVVSDGGRMRAWESANLGLALAV